MKPSELSELRGLDRAAVRRIFAWFDGDVELVKVVLRNQDLLTRVNDAEREIREIYGRAVVEFLNHEATT